MPYTNIVFVKFRLKILRDYRFTDLLNDSQKLLFFGLLVLGGECENEIPNSPDYIKRQLNLESDIKEIEGNLKVLGKVFPKLHTDNGVISWENFEKIHNYTIGKSQGNPKELQRMCKNKNKKKKEKKKEKEKEKKKEPTHPPFVFLEEKELQGLYGDYGKTVINEYITKINDYLSSTGKEPYLDYAATIRNWLRKDGVKKQPTDKYNPYAGLTPKEKSDWIRRREANKGKFKNIVKEVTNEPRQCR
jgi:hypothetical protein